MNLFEKLVSLRKQAIAREIPPARIDDEYTVESLYAEVAECCFKRAINGCSTLRFECWGRTKDRDTWGKRHKVCLEVVDLLKKEGLKAACESQFEEPYINVYGDIEYPESSNNIEVGWDHPWFPYKDGEEG